MKEHHCEFIPAYTFYGPPGSGKGTQSTMIKEKLSFFHLSAGDILRNAIKEGDPIALAVKGQMESGELVSDDLIKQMMQAALKKELDAHEGEIEGVILDGFPRTPVQAGMMEEMLEELGLCSVGMLNLNVPEDIVFERLLKRAEIEKRVDDNEVSIRKRIAAWNDNFEKLKVFFSGKYRFYNVNGVGEVDEVYGRIMNALGLTCRRLRKMVKEKESASA